MRHLLERSTDLVVRYLSEIEERPVLCQAEPGELLDLLPEEAPEHGEPLDRILSDVEQLILPRLTHWNHPGFMAYFGITGSAPGIAGELLAAATNVNAMLWRTSPAATELEVRVCDWLRRLVGLPDGFEGHINDTASIATLLALAAARHRSDGSIGQRGMAGRAELPAFTVYASDQAHVSVDKAALVLGLGLDNLRRVASDEAFRLSVQALEVAIESDLEAGRRPLAVVATAGTTSTTSVDPLAAVADVCRRHSLWLHVDAAYAGNAAICPEHRPRFAGWEAADSIVVNPHKWLFTPLDCSVLLLRDRQRFTDAFSLVPDYLRSDEESVNLMDLGIQLGRRFRALKLWMVMRTYGAEGLRARLREHCRLARRIASRLEEDERFDLLMEPPFSTVCFRLRAGRGEDEEQLNQRLVEAVNAAGEQFVSATRLDGRYVVRLTFGNLRTSEEHVEAVWRRLDGLATELAGRRMGR
ncbi:MAG: pyridoxal-dependent decarboxylase [Thermoanaerobaculia bacterium]|nr:pyridoxal-dependent decarboxylase [Thermoanaerobaculia bacterium]